MIRNAYLWLWILMLGGCAASPARQATTFDQIGTELAKGGTERAKPAQSDAVGAALLPPLRVEMPAMDGKPLEQRFDLVVNNAPANQVFMGIVNGTRYSMLVHPEVTGAISVNLKDVTVLEALDAIREIYGYEYKVEGNRIVIQPVTIQTRIFKVNYLVGRRQGASDTRVHSGSINTTSSSPTSTPGVTPSTGGTTSSVQESSSIYTSTRNDFWADLEDSVRTVIGCKMPTRSFGGGAGGIGGAGGASGAQRNVETVSGRGVDGCDGGRSVVINPQSGVVVVRATPSEQREVGTFLRASQLSVERQVILEAKILDVTLNDSYQAGVNWAGIANFGKTSVALGKSSGGFTAGQNATNKGINLDTSMTGYNPDTGRLTRNTTGLLDGTTLNPLLQVAGGVFGVAIANQNFSTLIDFLQTQGNVQVLSSPRIATLNNQKAVLKVGTDEFFVTSVSSTTTTGTATTTTPTVTLQPFFSGIALDVTPQIDENNIITLHIHPSVSKVSTVNKMVNLGSAGSIDLPLASSNVSETDSIVRARDGQIVAIGGLMRQGMEESRNGIPGVSDMPYVGALFRQTFQVSSKRELVILLKPTVVHDDEGWGQEITEAQRRMQTLERGFSYGGRAEVFGVGAENKRSPSP